MQMVYYGNTQPTEKRWEIGGEESKSQGQFSGAKSLSSQPIPNCITHAPLASNHPPNFQFEMWAVWQYGHSTGWHMPEGQPESIIGSLLFCRLWTCDYCAYGQCQEWVVLHPLQSQGRTGPVTDNGTPPPGYFRTCSTQNCAKYYARYSLFIGLGCGWHNSSDSWISQ